MSSISSTILDMLGLSQTVEKAQTAITATKQGVEAISAAKELLASPEGQKFRKKIIELMGGSIVTPDGAVHIDVAPAATPEAPKPQVARGHYVWDGFSATGWVWVSEE